MSPVAACGSKIASTCTPPLAEISTPGKMVSSRKPAGGWPASACALISAYAALSLSIHAPLLWSVTATQSIPAAMYFNNHICGVTSSGVPIATCQCSVAFSLEAGVCVWKSNFHQRDPG